MSDAGMDAAADLDPNALWRAVHGYHGVSEAEVRSELIERYAHVINLIADSRLNEIGRRVLTRAAFALYLDVRDAGAPTPLRALFFARTPVMEAQHDPARLSRRRYSPWGER